MSFSRREFFTFSMVAGVLAVAGSMLGEVPGVGVKGPTLRTSSELAPRSKARPDAPNILFILAEDIGTELSCYPENWAASLVRTPHIDRLAREGVRFSHSFTTAPVCSASRSALMTGMYQTSIGAHNHRTWPSDKRPLPAGVVTITDYFRAAGYFTCNVNQGKPKDPATGEKLPTGGRGSGKTDLNFEVDRLFDGTDWNQRASNQPFFAQLTIQESHKGIGWPLARRSPERVPQLVDPASIPIPPYYPDHPIVRDEMANYLDAIMLLDSYVGDVLARLEREELLANTIVVFLGDNGQCLARGKQFLYDGGIHVPFIIRWPDQRHAGTVDAQLVSGIDVSATLLGLAGITPNATMQGRDCLAADSAPREHIFAARDRMDVSTDRMRAVRSRRWKYIKNYFPQIPYQQHNAYKEKNYPTWNLLKEMQRAGTLNRVQAQFAGERKPIEELYDLAADPHEIANLALDSRHAATLKELRGIVSAWERESGDQGGTIEDPLNIYLGYWGHLPEDAPTSKPNYDN
ncbi:MAG TPA: sulfatase [Opitutus sp.]|nr:sulfatase [Opitutus sp.]